MIYTVWVSEIIFTYVSDPYRFPNAYDSILLIFYYTLLNITIEL